jgi:pimeloyl-ACP methyl ester carboxylesterase
MANPTVVLVHGAFADASGFRGLYNELLGEGVAVVAPPNPLRGLSGGDGEYFKAVVGEIDGPVLLAGHSYGGSVITAAGTADNVVGLVYISGFAPDEGENLTDLQSKFPAPGAIPYFRQHQLPEGGSEFTLAPEGSHESFCADLPADDAAFYAISQRPLAGVALTEAAVIAAPIAMHSTVPVGLGIFVVVVLLAVLAATGYFIGREYADGRWNRRDWN